MKFSVLAVDFDGTVATNDVLDSGARAALGELRAQGITVALVTGRILANLRQVAGDLHFADVVVAENGAVVEFPDSGYHTAYGDPPAEAFLMALREAGVHFSSGEVVVEASAADASRILAIIQRLELPLVLVFNRGRVMVLPQTISKATGLRQALSILRLSTHNAIAIGDAENDHELLRVCEVGVAVNWGSPALKAVADYVLPGDSPASVASYVGGLARGTRIPEPIHTRRRLLVGHTDTGSPLALAVRGRNVLVAGDPRSGKSWVAGLLCEQLILYGYSLCILDPEGDYVSLEALPGVTVFGGADPLPRPRDLLRALRHADVSVVIDLSHVDHDQKVDYLRTLLPALATLRRHTGLPHRIVLDEAHYFLHDSGISGLVDLELNGYTVVTYRASQLHADVLRSSEAIIVTRESDPKEVRALMNLCATCGDGGSEAEWAKLLGGLGLGEAAVLPLTEESGGHLRRIRLIPRLTPHVRHLAKYLDVPVPESRAFVFWRDGTGSRRRARTLRELVTAVEQSPLPDLDGHLRRGDFSRWVEDVFGDYPLGKTIRQIEAQWRAGATRDAADLLGQAVRSRYEFLDPVMRPP